MESVKLNTGRRGPRSCKSLAIETELTIGLEMNAERPLCSGR